MDREKQDAKQMCGQKDLMAVGCGYQELTATSAATRLMVSAGIHGQLQWSHQCGVYCSFMILILESGSHITGIAMLVRTGGN